MYNNLTKMFMWCYTNRDDTFESAGIVVDLSGKAEHKMIWLSNNGMIFL